MGQDIARALRLGPLFLLLLLCACLLSQIAEAGCRICAPAAPNCRNCSADPSPSCLCTGVIIDGPGGGCYQISAGTCYSNVPDLQRTRQSDPTILQQCGGVDNPKSAMSTLVGNAKGMCVANAHTMLVSLHLNDTPIGYAAPVGPAVRFNLTYNHRDAATYSTVGPKWSHNFLAYIEDDTANPGQSVKRFVGGGGYYDEAGYVSGTGAFAAELQSQAVLTRTPATGTATSYTLSFPDGTSQTFGYGVSGTPHRLLMTSITDAQGKSLTLAYDGSNRLASITDASGRATTLSYTNANPQLITLITDPFGRTTALGYDTTGRLTSITDVLGITSSFVYHTTDTSFIKQLITPYGTSNFSGGGTTSSTYRWLTLTDPLGYSDYLEYTPSAPGISDYPPTATPTGMSLPTVGYAQAASYHWDKHAYAVGYGYYAKAVRTQWLTNAQLQISSTPLLVKPQLENPTYFNYPGQTQNYQEGTSAAPSKVGLMTDATTSQVTQLAYNALGKPTSVTDPLGRVTTMAYDASGVDLGTIQQKTSASGYTTTSVLSNYSNHLPGDYQDAAGQHWLKAYTADKQVSSVTNPLGQYTQYFYDAYKRLITVKNTNNDVIRTYHYPCDTSTTGLVNCNLPDWVKTFDGVDVNGYQVSYLYDKFDRIKQITYPDATTELYDYNFPTTWPIVAARGTPSLDLWKVTDRMGRITTYGYDQNRRMTSVTETVTVAGVVTTRTTSYGYYENNTLKTLTDANGNVTRWDIDLQSRPTAKTYAYGTAAAKTETYTYDLAGRLKTVTDAKAQVLTNTYNADNTLASYAYTNPVIATPGASFTYDPYFQRRTSMTDQFGTTTWTYKALGTNGALNPDTEDGPFGNDTVALGYDVAGRVTSRSVGGATAESFGFDALGRLTSHGTDLGSFTYGYLGVTGTVASRTVGTVTTNFGYDTTANDRRLLTISTTGAAARNFTYASNAYQITGITDTPTATHPWLGQTWSFSYDGSDRLLTGNGTIAGNSSFSYDKLDNATSFAGVTGVYDGLNQISTFNALTHTYDNNGNLTSDGTRTYTYDAADRLKTVTQGGTTTTFAYDGLGRRLKQTVGATETRHLWCGAAICQQRDATDVVQKRFTAEGEYVLTGTKKYLYLTDHLGSVRDLVDITTTPTLVGSFDYTPYGAVARSWGTVTPGYTYAGLFYHLGTGLLLSATRAYDPAKGRFLNRDMIPGWGFGYGNASPMLNIDPWGLDSCPAWAVNDCINSLGDYQDTIIGGGVAGKTIGKIAINLIRQCFAQEEPPAQRNPPPKNFVTPTNPPQLPKIPPGWVSRPGSGGQTIWEPPGTPPGSRGPNIRIDTSPSEGYPNGRWIQKNPGGQPINPATGRPGPPQDTHVPLPKP